MLGSRKLYRLKENDLFSFRFENEEKRDQQQQFIIHLSDLLALRYGTRSLLRKTTKMKGLRVLMSEKGREGGLTLFTETLCELTTLHILFRSI